MPQMLDHSTLNRLEFSRLFLTAHGNLGYLLQSNLFSYVNILLIIINVIMKVMYS
jgi:hypothetical protein